MRTSLPMLAAALAALALPASVLAASPQVEEGKALVLDLEEKRAIEVLEAVEQSATASDADKAEANLWIGIARVNLLEFDAAKESFRKALKLDAKLAAPENASPKAQRLLEDARAELAPKPAEPAPTPAPPEAVAKDEGPQRGTLTTAAYVSGGAGVVALGVAAVLGVSSQGSYDAAVAAGDGATALTERDAAIGSANAANALFITGGVLVATGAALWVLDMPAADRAEAAKDVNDAAKKGAEAKDEFSLLAR